MTRKARRPELPELEPPLPELSRLRELARLDVPPAEVQQAVLGRIQRTLGTRLKVVHRERSVTPWALGLGMLVAVPSALAATSLGEVLVQRTARWVERTFTPIETTASPPERNQRTSARVAGDTSPGQHALLPEAASRTSPNNEVAFPPAVTALETEVAPQPVHEPLPGATQRLQQKSKAHDASKVHEREPNNSVLSRVETETLSRERRLLERARVRLGARDTQGALELTSLHEAQFPNGLLASERRSIINQARMLEAQLR